jgi:hypothetical protein
VLPFAPKARDKNSQATEAPPLDRIGRNRACGGRNEMKAERNLEAGYRTLQGAVSFF